MICKNCQQENAADALFCKYCGTPMNVQEEAPVQEEQLNLLQNDQTEAAQAEPEQTESDINSTEPPEQNVQKNMTDTQNIIKKEPLITINPAVVEQAKVYKDEAISQAKVYAGEAVKGAKIGAEKLKGLSKKQKQILLGIVAAILLIVVIANFNKGPEEKIIGTWEVSARSQNESLRYYPEDDIRFIENGICHVDGTSFSYYFEGDSLYLDSMWGDYAYYYEFRSGQLVLKEHTKDADDPWIYYNKIS